jgi:PepSY-associated transmembrane protein
MGIAMVSRRWHRLIGIVMLLPLIIWAVTGLVFFIKPGYKQAFEILQPKMYALEEKIALTPEPDWLEVRCFRTVLGYHLIVRTANGWSHLDPDDLSRKPLPTEDAVRRLAEDAFSSNPQRYGAVTGVEGNEIRTDTGVHVSIDWNRLAFEQRGRDTDTINRLYKLHYLQWTGLERIDQTLGILGISLLLALAILGLRLFFASR